MLYGIAFITLMIIAISCLLSEKDKNILMDKQCIDVMQGFYSMYRHVLYDGNLWRWHCIFHSARRNRCFYILDFISIWIERILETGGLPLVE